MPASSSSSSSPAIMRRASLMDAEAICNSHVTFESRMYRLAVIRLALKLDSSQPNHSPCLTSAFASTRAAPERPYDARQHVFSRDRREDARTQESPPPVTEAGYRLGAKA
jgi:hypothetical protein